MSICACLFFKTTQGCKVYQVAFSFTINMANEEIIVSFGYDCKI